MILSSIYQIQSNIKPERVYIGSAVNIQQRWKNHLKLLKGGCHHSIKLQNHFNKYGEQDLWFTVLEDCFKDLLIRREQYYIDILNPWFNIYKTAGSPLGTKRSEEVCRKSSVFMQGNTYRLGKSLSKEHIEALKLAGTGGRKSDASIRKGAETRKKPLLQYDLQGEFIKEWPSAVDVNKKLLIDKATICQCCNPMNRHKTAGGFIWKLKNN